MRRAVFDKLGPFNERLGVGFIFKSGEDTGAYFGYVPDMVFYHFRGRRERDQLVALVAGYDEGNGALYAKFMRRYPELLRPLYCDIRSGVRELADGPKADIALHHSHLKKVAGNLRGMVRMMMACGGSGEVSKDSPLKETARGFTE